MTRHFPLLFLFFFLISSAVSRRQTGNRGRGGGRSPPVDRALSTLMTRLWNEDRGKARYVAIGNAQGANVDVRLSIGGRTRSSATNDAAANRLFTYVNENRLFGHPTTRLMIGLFDDFRLSSAVREDQETNRNNKREVEAFLTAIINTRVMQLTYDYVRANNLIRNLTPQRWRSTLYRIWFKLYSRHRGVLGSSGFEHVFLGEIDDGQAKGIHNWVWIYKQEKLGNLDYQGHISSLTFNPCVARGRFVLKENNRNYGKPMTSFMPGATPEFEMAMFTLAFLKHPNAIAHVEINRVNLKIQTYKNRDGSLATAFLA